MGEQRPRVSFGFVARTEGTPTCDLTGNPTPSTAALEYDSSLIGALELSSKKWVFAVQLLVM